MKKTLLFLLNFCFSFPLFAKANLCGYVDFFHLDDLTDPRIIILSAYGDSNVHLEIIGLRSFQLQDSEQCQAGYAHINLAFDLNHWCMLEIKDGPYIHHPIMVSASCYGLVYNGMKYDGFNSYSYSLNFS